MNITSISFVVFVVIIVLLCNACNTSNNARLTIILLANMIFYASYSFVGLPVLALTTFCSFLCGKAIQSNNDSLEKTRADNSLEKNEFRRLIDENDKKNKQIEIVAITVNIGALFLLKYLRAWLIGANVPLVSNTAASIIVPLGISYYSLMLTGYIIDVGRGIIKAERNYLKLFCFSTLFMSILQGPFLRYEQFKHELEEKKINKLTIDVVMAALIRIMWGLIKKLCVADQLSRLTVEIFNNPDSYGLANILGAICFAVQLYTDFSGYMDIMVGVGQLIDFEIPENFRQPFFARNISEFWKRWHITLGLWLQDYVFYPLLRSTFANTIKKLFMGFTNKKKARDVTTAFALLVLWTLIGFWHGASLHFVLSVGIFQFIFVMYETHFEKRIKAFFHIKDENGIVRIMDSLRVCVLMTFSWVFFFSDSMNSGWNMIKNIFAEPIGYYQIQHIFELSDGLGDPRRAFVWILYLAIWIIILFIVDLNHEKGVYLSNGIMRMPFLKRMMIILVMVFTLIVFGAYGSKYVASNFIYVEF